MLRYTEKEVKQYAIDKAQTVVIRTYNNGNSRDTRRTPTVAESMLLESAIGGALLAIREGRDIDAAASVAEYVAGGDWGGENNNINTYDSVYIPIKEFIDNRKD